MNEGGTINQKILLHKKDLLSFDGWNSRARQYLNQLDDDIELLPIIEEYREKVLDFYRWYRKSQVEIHSDDLDKLNKKKNEYALLRLSLDINSSLKNINGDPPYLGESVFVGFLSYKELQKLKSFNPDDPQRAEYAINTIDQKFPLSDELKIKINQLYANEKFQKVISP